MRQFCGICHFGQRHSVRSGGLAAAPASSSEIAVPTLEEAALRDQLGATKAQFDGVRAYINKIGSDASDTAKKRRADRTPDPFSDLERLPSRRQLGGNILKLAADEAFVSSMSAVKRLLRESARATLTWVQYKRSNKTHVFGAFVGIVGERHILESWEEAHNHNGIATAAEMAYVTGRLATEAEVDIGCVCTDDTGQCGRSWRILSLRYPSLLFLHYLAHQLILLKRHLMAQARLSPQRMYAASLAIWTVGETRWSTLQMYMASLLRFRRTLSCLFTELGHASPQAFLTLKSPGFWVTLQTAEWTIRRIASASFVLERDDTTPADVFYVYGSIYQHLAGSSVRLGEHGLTADLKRRWSQEEQALFSLAFCLHPCYMQPGVADATPEIAVFGTL
ncbi:hypothetical protein BU14_0374s0015 [Porphyra umbilicalis]|uniref:DUF659 domain-containing protein n=1 Tax=Porphyra umbilicalis TaxID=2786 RepID=A0A1X6NX05_PORUM|nr:hypothetical protein BU14_0374s0015 [Porphyra umbilicalis]|eukprot:OSX73141.1 hypothetical protein BU14_0374s0015 [Porphyra umbilicalis]